MTKRVKLTILISLLFSLQACRFIPGGDEMFRDRGGDYLEAQILPQMEVPSELDSYTLDQLYVIPERLFTASEAFDDTPMPKPIATRRREGVIIQSLNERRWIVIDATPGQVWPLVRDYWTSLQIVLDYEDPGAGIMETAWVEVDNDQDKRHKYQILIEPGLHSGYSEIYVLHLENQRDDPIPLVASWPESSNSPDLEQQVMRSVSQYLGDRNDVYQASSASLLAGSIEAESKANILENERGEQFLELKIDYDRAWVQIRQALESAEISIVDFNRDQSFFNVRFAGILDEEDSPGFIGRLFGGDSEQSDMPELDFSVRLLETDSAVNVMTEALSSSETSSQIMVELLQVINDNLG